MAVRVILQDAVPSTDATLAPDPAAEARLAIVGHELAEWQCRRCSESVPGYFKICWQCEQARNPGTGNTVGLGSPSYGD